MREVKKVIWTITLTMFFFIAITGTTTATERNFFLALDENPKGKIEAVLWHYQILNQVFGSFQIELYFNQAELEKIIYAQQHETESSFVGYGEGYDEDWGLEVTSRPGAVIISGKIDLTTYSFTGYPLRKKKVATFQFSNEPSDLRFSFPKTTLGGKSNCLSRSFGLIFDLRKVREAAKSPLVANNPEFFSLGINQPAYAQPKTAELYLRICTSPGTSVYAIAIENDGRPLQSESISANKCGINLLQKTYYDFAEKDFRSANWIFWPSFIATDQENPQIRIAYGGTEMVNYQFDGEYFVSNQAICQQPEPDCQNVSGMVQFMTKGYQFGESDNSFSDQLFPAWNIPLIVKFHNEAGEMIESVISEDGTFQKKLCIPAEIDQKEENIMFFTRVYQLENKETGESLNLPLHNKDLLDRLCRSYYRTPLIETEVVNGQVKINGTVGEIGSENIFSTLSDFNADISWKLIPGSEKTGNALIVNGKFSFSVDAEEDELVKITVITAEGKRFSSYHLLNGQLIQIVLKKEDPKEPREFFCANCSNDGNFEEIFTLPFPEWLIAFQESDFLDPAVFETVQPLARETLSRHFENYFEESVIEKNSNGNVIIRLPEDWEYHHDDKWAEEHALSLDACQLEELNIFCLPHETEFEPENETSEYHSADYNPSDHIINLSELLRIIQLYNSSEYHYNDSGEDDYGIGEGNRDCKTHTSDYNPQDWHISLSELLRMIQFYNSSSYQADPNGEDGFSLK